MKDFRQRKKIDKSFNPILVLLVLFLIFLFLSHAAYISFQKKQKAHKEGLSYENRLQNLLDKKEYYLSENKKLNTKEGVMRELKDKYELGENGETIIHIVESDNLKVL